VPGARIDDGDDAPGKPGVPRFGDDGDDAPALYALPGGAYDCSPSRYVDAIGDEYALPDACQPCDDGLFSLRGNDPQQNAPCGCLFFFHARRYADAGGAVFSSTWLVYSCGRSCGARAPFEQKVSDAFSGE
jgi:hypothetical protein